MATNDIISKHDSMFKIGMRKLEIAESAIRRYIPSEIVEQLNFNTLTLCNGSYIDEDIRESHSDILYSVECLDKTKSYLYFIWEHQSSYDKNIALRPLSYSCRIMQQH